MAMDQYLYIPFLGGWTSINTSYFDVHQGDRVLTHPHMAARVSHTRDSTEVFLYPERPSKGKNRRLEAAPWWVLC